MTFDPELRLSANFRLKEFIRSDFATRLGRIIVPGDEEVDNLTRLCQTILQPLRNALRTNIRITSGFRPEWLNRAIGGSATSAHMYGCAADIEAEGCPHQVTISFVRTLLLPIDQCILEFPPDGWVHLGVERLGAKVRGQFLRATKIDGKTVYQNVGAGES